MLEFSNSKRLVKTTRFWWKCTFMLWPDQYQKIFQIKAWYYRIDLKNPLKSYNGLDCGLTILWLKFKNAQFQKKKRPRINFELKLKSTQRLGTQMSPMSFLLHQFLTASSLLIQMGSQSCSKQTFPMLYFVFSWRKISTGFPL